MEAGLAGWACSPSACARWSRHEAPCHLATSERPPPKGDLRDLTRCASRRRRPRRCTSRSTACSTARALRRARRARGAGRRPRAPRRRAAVERNLRLSLAEAARFRCSSTARRCRRRRRGSRWRCTSARGIVTTCADEELRAPSGKTRPGIAARALRTAPRARADWPARRRFGRPAAAHQRRRARPPSANRPVASSGTSCGSRRGAAATRRAARSMRWRKRSCRWASTLGWRDRAAASAHGA